MDEIMRILHFPDLCLSVLFSNYKIYAGWVLQNFEDDCYF